MATDDFVSYFPQQPRQALTLQKFWDDWNANELISTIVGDETVSPEFLRTVSRARKFEAPCPDTLSSSYTACCQGTLKRFRGTKVLMSMCGPIVCILWLISRTALLFRCIFSSFWYSLTASCNSVRVLSFSFQPVFLVLRSANSSPVLLLSILVFCRGFPHASLFFWLSSHRYVTPITLARSLARSSSFLPACLSAWLISILFLSCPSPGHDAEVTWSSCCLFVVVHL